MNEATPCRECFPGAHEYNQDAYTLYCYVGGQYIMGPNGAVTLNLLAIDKIFDYFRIHLDDRPELYVKIQRISQVSIETAHKEADRLRRAAEAQAQAQAKKR